jgi:hypothetical protein
MVARIEKNVPEVEAIIDGDEVKAECNIPWLRDNGSKFIMIGSWIAGRGLLSKDATREILDNRAEEKAPYTKRCERLENRVCREMEEVEGSGDLSYEEIVQYARSAGFTESEGMRVAENLGRAPTCKRHSRHAVFAAHYARTYAR